KIVLLQQTLVAWAYFVEVFNEYQLVCFVFLEFGFGDLRPQSSTTFRQKGCSSRTFCQVLQTSEHF
ncbi:22868_t:CDS:1, partial [Dentiscutata erythropus]